MNDPPNSIYNVDVPIVNFTIVSVRIVFISLVSAIVHIPKFNIVLINLIIGVTNSINISPRLGKARVGRHRLGRLG